jgi:hypothetical protein
VTVFPTKGSARLAHHRRQTATRPRPLPLQGRRRHGPLSRSRRHRRQRRQHRSRTGKAGGSLSHPDHPHPRQARRVRRNRALNCWPWVRSLTQSPVAAIHYRDPVRSSKGHFVKASGLRWLSAMLPWADRIMALPFLTLLAPSKRFYTGKSRPPRRCSMRGRSAE